MNTMHPLRFIWVWLAVISAQAQNPDLRAPAPPPPGHAGVRLTGPPGDYTIQTATNLPVPEWTSETNLVIGPEGFAETTVPFLDRSCLFIRARGFSSPTGTPHAAEFWTQGALFSPAVAIDDLWLESLLWTWSDATTSTNYPEASHEFGAAAERVQSLSVEPVAALTALNLGFDASDGGETTPLPFRASQNVSAIHFPQPLTGLRYFAASYNPLTNTLDFTGFTALEAVECFMASTLQHVVLTNLPSLKRVCLEDADLQELDLSGNPALEDLRGALNGYTEIRLDRGTGPAIWHWCTRDNPQLAQSFQDLMTNCFALREFFIWNDNQSGHLAPVSTNLQHLLAANNHFTSADFTGHDTLLVCDLSANALTNLVLEGCTALQTLDAHANQLGTAALDALLAFLDTSAPGLYRADLAQNAGLPSGTGYAHCAALIARGVSVSVDWPDAFDGLTNAAGGAEAITFVTTGRQPHMEIRTENGSPTNLLWHWGDGWISRGARIADHDFGAEGIWTNYVEVQPPSCVTYFGARSGYTGQGIQAVNGAAHFPALSYLYLYQQGLAEISLAGCSALVQLHLAGNAISAETCDQWFLDLDAAVAGPVAGADFFYPAAARTSASDAAWSNLVAKGYAMHPL